jgi:hypothetical protein
LIKLRLSGQMDRYKARTVVTYDGAWVGNPGDNEKISGVT